MSFLNRAIPSLRPAAAAVARSGATRSFVTRSPVAFKPTSIAGATPELVNNWYVPRPTMALVDPRAQQPACAASQHAAGPRCAAALALARVATAAAP